MPLYQCPAIRDAFPVNTHLQKLLNRAGQLGIRFGVSRIPQQWLYHPRDRTIYIWPHDLTSQSVSFLVVVLAHEIGHAIDFDRHPEHQCLTRNLHWSEVPRHIERNAFVFAFLMLQELQIPMRLWQFCEMIEEPMSEGVNHAICREFLCILPSEVPLARVS